MRKIKKISLSALTLSFLVAVTACSNSNIPTDTTPTASTTITEKEIEYPDMKVEAVEQLDYTERFSSISIDTANAKTLYYMGESFDPTGIEVTGYFVQTFADGSHNSVTKKMTNVSYNLENVDFNKAGTYNVLVQARNNATVQERTFKINVQSSILAESGETYVGGIEVSYNDKFKTDLILGESFTFDKSKVSAKLVLCKSGEVIEKKDISTDKLTIDTSALTSTTPEVGTYQIKYSYSGNKISYKGKEYENNVQSYTLVNVTNDITKIEYLTGGNTVFYASTAGIDLSAWVVQITRENGKTEKKKCTSDLFTVSNLNSYVVSLEQKIRITSVENPNCYFDKSVEIRESQTQDIIVASALCYINKDGSASEDINGDASKHATVQYGTTTLYQLGRYTNTIDGKETALIYGNPTKVSADSGSSTDGIAFSNRPTIKGNSQPVVVDMKKAGTIIVYISPTSDGAERNLSVSKIMPQYDEDGAPILDENGKQKQALTEIHAYVTGTAPKVAVGYRFDAEEAGEYVFTSSDGVYLWGFIIATDKD